MKYSLMAVQLHAVALMAGIIHAASVLPDTHASFPEYLTHEIPSIT